MLEKEKLDEITVVTPDPFHKDIVLAAAESGVNVLCEKPLDITVEGCQEMIDACEKASNLFAERRAGTSCVSGQNPGSEP